MWVKCKTRNTLDALSTLMMNSDNADVNFLEVGAEAATTEGWAALAKALSKTSVHVRHLLVTRELLREGIEEDLETIYEKCHVSHCAP